MSSPSAPVEMADRIQQVEMTTTATTTTMAPSAGARNRPDQPEAAVEDDDGLRDLEDPDSKPDADVIPDGGYGWVCVACNFWINAHTWGLNSTYGVFLSYYLSHNVFSNTSNLTFAFMGGLSMGCAFLVAPLATFLMDHFGNRAVRNMGTLLETISFIGASFSTRDWQIILSQGICFGMGFGFLYIGSSGITPQWFLKKRSVANGLTSAGSGLGGMIYSLSVGAMIPKLGLPWTFRILAILALTVNLLASNLLQDRNKAVGARYKAFQLPLFKRPEFLLYQGWGIFSALGYVILVFSVANFALSIGLSAHQGSIITAILNLGQCLGRPFVGYFSDRLGRINIACLLSFICGLLCLVFWIFAENMAACCAFAFIIGTLSGTYWATANPVMVEVIGLSDLPSGISLSYMMLVVPCAVAEAIALQLRDESSRNRAYLRVQILTGFMYIGGAICLWLVRSWKVGTISVQRERESRESATMRAEGAMRQQSASERNQDPLSQTVEPDVVPDPPPPPSRKAVWRPAVLLRSSWTWERV